MKWVREWASEVDEVKEVEMWKEEGKKKLGRKKEDFTHWESFNGQSLDASTTASRDIYKLVTYIQFKNWFTLNW